MSVAATLRIDDEKRRRAASAAGVAVLHAVLGYGFLIGLGVGPLTRLVEPMKLFDATETPPPPPPPATPARPDIEKKVRKARPKEAEGSASPANLRDTPTEVMAPPPQVRLPVPPPIPAAAAPGTGNAPAAGAASVPGPGMGAGGQGTGLGSGLSGNGTGGGGGGGRGIPARWLKGSVGPEDYPRRAYEARAQGTVYLRFTIGTDGRVKACAVTRSSGNAELDRITCQLIQRRFRYRPARDAEGQPVEDVLKGQQAWEIGAEPPPIDIDPEPEP